MAQPSEANRPAGRSLLAGAGGGRFAPAFDRFFEVLTDDQRASFREAMDTQRDKARNLQEKLRDARKELMETGLAANFDEDTVRQKAMEAAKLEAEMTVLRAKALSQMKPSLTTEQIEKLKNLPPFTPPNADQGAALRHRPESGRDENDLPPRSDNQSKVEKQ
jgi:Spy/CpxP family protein refolding chaperone